MIKIIPVSLSRTEYVNAVWDKEAGVFYSRSNIKGLYIEAPTIEEFTDLAREYRHGQV